MFFDWFDRLLRGVCLTGAGQDFLVRGFLGYICYATGKLAPAQDLANRVVLPSFNRAGDGGKGRIFYTLPIMVADSAWSKSETIEHKNRHDLNTANELQATINEVTL